LDIGAEIFSIQFKVLHEDELLQIVSVEVTGAASDWQIAYRGLPGETRIAVAGASPIDESGDIVLIEYRVSSDPGVTGCDLEPVEIVADEGRVFVEGTGGVFSLGNASADEYASLTVFSSELIPNPTMGQVDIDLGIPASSSVKIAIYDASGRLVKRLIDGKTLPRGRSRIRWNGERNGGGKVSPGVYFVSVKMAGYNKTHRLIIVE
jgi:hypothetical protein